jgi:hypothetical protein
LVWFVPIDHAGELNESAVPGILDDASVMIGDFGIENGISKSFQFRQSVFFVDPYQAARARDIRRQNSCQSPHYVIAAQGAPPGSGKLSTYIAELWADVRLCSCPKRVKSGKAQWEHMFSALPLKADVAQRGRHVRFVPILLKKSKIEQRRKSRES